MVLASRVLSLLSASLWVLSLTTPVLGSRDKDGISMIQTALGGTESGLKADDRVVTAGLLRAIPGQKVDPQMQKGDATPAAAK